MWTKCGHFYCGRTHLAITRLLLARPTFGLVDRPSTSLGKTQLRESLQRFSENSITYITFDESSDLTDLYDVVLEIDPDGTWTWRLLGKEDSSQ